MDPNFETWVSLHVNDVTAARYARYVTQALSNSLFARDVFASEFTLLDTLHTYTYRNLDIYHMMGVVVDRSTDAPYRPQDTRANGSLYNIVHGISWYTRFLGHTYPRIRQFATKLSYHVRHAAHSRLLASCVFSNVFLRTHLVLLDIMRSAQRSIDTRIGRYMRYRNLAENPHSLRLFGRVHLRPFLELLLRVTVVPLSIRQIQTLRCPDPTDVSTTPVHALCFQTDPCRLRYTHNRDRMELLVPVSSNGVHTRRRRRAKPVALPLSRRLSAYLWFYMHYCTSSATRVFVGTNGGQWTSPLDDLQTYLLDTLRVPPSLAARVGLGPGVRRDYVQVTKRVWLSARVAQHRSQYSVDQSVAVADALLARIGIGVENERYRDVFHSLRQSSRAVKILETVVAGDIVHAADWPVATDCQPDRSSVLHPLLDELRSGIRPPLNPPPASMRGREPVARHQSLYSQEYVDAVPAKYWSVRDYVNRAPPAQAPTR